MHVTYVLVTGDLCFSSCHVTQINKKNLYKICTINADNHYE